MSSLFKLFVIDTVSLAAMRSRLMTRNTVVLQISLQLSQKNQNAYTTELVKQL